MSTQINKKYPGTIVKIKKIKPDCAIFYYDALKPYTNSTQRAELLYGREITNGSFFSPSAFDPYVTSAFSGRVFSDSTEKDDRMRFLIHPFYICVNGLTKKTLDQLVIEKYGSQYYHVDTQSELPFEGTLTAILWLDYKVIKKKNPHLKKRDDIMGMPIMTYPGFEKKGYATELVRAAYEDNLGKYLGLSCEWDLDRLNDESVKTNNFFKSLQKEGWITSDGRAYIKLR